LLSALRIYIGNIFLEIFLLALSDLLCNFLNIQKLHSDMALVHHGDPLYVLAGQLIVVFL
jgi:hypothetical protein